MKVSDLKQIVLLERGTKEWEQELVSNNIEIHGISMLLPKITLRRCRRSK